MYQKVSTDLKFVDREKKIEKFWEENNIFEKRKATYRARINSCDQRYDSEISHNERVHGT